MMKRILILGLLAALVSGCMSVDSDRVASGEDWLAPGISLGLARARAALIEDVCYDLFFRIDEGEDTVEGEIEIRFHLQRETDRLVLDFGGQKLYSLVVNGKLVDEPAWLVNHISIDGNRVTKGPNRIQLRFSAPVGEGGTALTRLRDQNDGNEYFYTLLVPGDAHLLFPCFDQPDLKARCKLTLNVPPHWSAAANNPVERSMEIDQRLRIDFKTTPPLSTYLIAFAAGPFIRIEEQGQKNPMAFFIRPSRIDAVDADALFKLHRESVDWLTQYFEVPYPFDKLDFVLIPGFPYGGMEHPGSIFYRENVLAFESAPTARDLLRRSTLIYHEVSHMWFGDLVTMKWFDDLWLKEGYATFMSYKLLEALQPRTVAWKRFSQNVEPRAYQVELTRGTTPVYQELGNLAHAKSAYGAIVYNKAPAVLRQLEFLIGDEEFRKSASRFLMRHAYANATWADLVRCCEEVSGRSLGGWSDAWIIRKGMPEVTVAFPPTGGVTLVQEGVHDEEALWPFRTRVAAAYDDGSIEQIDVDVEEREVFLDIGTPEFVFANSGDFAYGRFPLDDKSLEAVLAGLHEVSDPFLKSLLYDTLWDMVKAGELAPVRYISLALESVTSNGDPLDCTAFLNNMGNAFQLYLSRKQVEEWGPLVERRLEQIMDHDSADPALRLSCFRSYMELASTEEGIERLVAMLDGERIPSGITLAPRDRWKVIKHLIVEEYKEARALFDAEAASDRSVDATRYRFETRSAFPDVKEEYFGYYAEETAFAESWLQASLDGFNATKQQALTLPYLEKALEMSPWLKEHRKIFFLPRWLDSFITSRTSRAAADVVNGFLDERNDLPRDIVLKIHQSLDPLEDTVRIRKKYADQ